MKWKKVLPWIGMAAATLLCFALGFLIPVSTEEEPVDPLYFLSEVQNAETLSLYYASTSAPSEERTVQDAVMREKIEEDLQIVLSEAKEIDASEVPFLVGGERYSLRYERCPGVTGSIALINDNGQYYLALSHDRYYEFKNENAIAEFYALWEALDCPIEEAGTRH